MRLGETDSGAYLDGWTRGEWTGSATAAVRRSETGSSPSWRSMVDRSGWRRTSTHSGPRRTRGTREPAASPLGQDGPVLLDGAMGTMLQEAGLDDGGAGELWNVERPDEIAAIHERTCRPVPGSSPRTPSAAPGPAAMHGLDDRVHELNRAGARVASRVADATAPGRRRHRPDRRAARAAGGDDRRRGPGDVRRAGRGLADGGVDLILIETMSDLGEVEAAIERRPARSSRAPGASRR